MTYRLYRWRVINYEDNPYLAPEANPKCLVGFRDQDTKMVRTSPIAKVNGREITTHSGSIYILEDMDPDYRQWLEDNGITFDPDSPLKVIKVK